MSLNGFTTTVSNVVVSSFLGSELTDRRHWLPLENISEVNLAECRTFHPFSYRSASVLVSHSSINLKKFFFLSVCSLMR